MARKIRPTVMFDFTPGEESVVVKGLPQSARLQTKRVMVAQPATKAALANAILVALDNSRLRVPQVERMKAE